MKSQSYFECEMKVDQFFNCTNRVTSAIMSGFSSSLIYQVDAVEEYKHRNNTTSFET